MWQCPWKGSRRLPVVFVDEATGGGRDARSTQWIRGCERRSALRCAEIETVVRSLSVVVIDVRVQH
jgi:hypothetical protein